MVPEARSYLSRANRSLNVHRIRRACGVLASTGGVWIRHADAVDLSFLRPEDEFCVKLKKLSAEWWQLPPDFEANNDLGEGNIACETLDDCLHHRSRTSTCLPGRNSRS
jgi:hypothetical protein